MTDFASATMVRVLAQGMRQLGLTPPEGLDLQAGSDARIGLDHKRLLVTAALGQGGIGSLALLGRGLRRFRDEPIHQALMSARGAVDLFARWGRLERYIHSRHRIVVESVEEGATGGTALLRHESRHGPPPLAVEDLVLLGVLAALLEELGLHDVRAWVGDAQVVPDSNPQTLTDIVRGAQTARWTLSWSGCMAPGVPRPKLQGTVAPTTTPVALSDSAWSQTACEVAELLSQDLATPLPIADLAQRMRLSKRSLQRTLADAGLSFSAVLAQTRCRTASWWLIHTATPLAEVGFVCGYSDQPHFTRDFRSRVGLPPAVYRQAFGSTQRGDV